MPRLAKLRKKRGQWYTDAGGRSGTYFGSVKEVSYKEAKDLFAEHTKAKNRQGGGVAVADLIFAFLDWLEKSRSDRTYGERKLHLERFAHFNANGQIIGQLAASGIDSDDLRDFLLHVAGHEWVETSPEVWAWVKRDKPLDPFTVGKHQTSVMACFAWGAGRKNAKPITKGVHPFAGMERFKRPAEPLLEGELPTSDEIRSLFKHADDDLGVINEKGSYRARRQDEERAGHPYKGFGDMLRVYHQAGARTSELAEARVSHFQKTARQIVLKKHKRSNTEKESSVRRITLTDESFAIVAKLCGGKNPADPIFADPKGRAWTRYTLDSRFQKVRDRAKVRKEITIYSFRHLWISEAIMNGIDVATVAKMAGTSIAMVEKVYGHFTNDHFADAQRKLDEARQRSPGAIARVAVAVG